ncbi:copper chaperone PCu(A)C [Massilia violaceinigra]|uniref:Copper chaperone PCu(A)C n=1 Tax=Massilia violaceinigra TaxID=2045208 RepID=A0ABY4A0A2_9BURK|nr:copper chaperone PCu(A)C [Massilia violaceinigra]UOD28173.1 copper chaperone PCu(A)C [Massilia violaceinigra]
MNKNIYALVALCAFASSAFAQIKVDAPWARATVPVQKTSGAFMQLQSPTDVRLVGASSPVAGSVEMHKMEMKGDQMKMEQVDAIELPANKAVKLASGGYHLMLIDLKRQLKAGDSVPLTLTIEHPNKKRESMTVQVPVKPLNFVSQPGAHAAH